jgi:hypothetical protein
MFTNKYLSGKGSLKLAFFLFYLSRYLFDIYHSRNGSKGRIFPFLEAENSCQELETTPRSRARAFHREQRDLVSGMAVNVRDLSMGFVGGITGVFTKPVEGAAQEGALGFFKVGANLSTNFRERKISENRKLYLKRILSGNLF